jgi:N6-adenosine-specific RNA methylase IME4
VKDGIRTCLRRSRLLTLSGETRRDFTSLLDSFGEHTGAAQTIVTPHESDATGALREHVGKNYSVIYADPPWRYKSTSPTASTRPHGFSAGACYYYSTLSLADIQALPVSQCAARDAACFMWATVPLLPEALDTLRAWGFPYKTTITWHKLNSKGMGYWFRGYTEFLLVGIRGKLKAFHSLQPNIVATKVGAHSAKPPIFARMIEDVVPGSKLELFARTCRPGWASWGEEPEASLSLLSHD